MFPQVFAFSSDDTMIPSACAVRTRVGTFCTLFAVVHVSHQAHSSRLIDLIKKKYFVHSMTKVTLLMQALRQLNRCLPDRIVSKK